MCLFEREACGLKHLNAFLNAMKADAALIHRPVNIRWLSGYTGEGCLFIAKGVKAIVTDFRYVEQAKRQCPGWDVIMVTAERRYGAVGAELAADYPLCGQLNAELGASVTAVPYHTGAASYFTEKGMTVPVAQENG